MTSPWRGAGWVAAGLLGACASYTPLPLPAAAPAASSLPESLAGHAYSADQLAALALTRDPELIAARTQHGAAEAQSFAAGVLPNPSVGASILPLYAGIGDTTAWNAGLTYDVKALITLSARRHAARDAALQVDAQLLWQEWQVVGTVRLLAVDLTLDRQALAGLARARDLLAARRSRSRAALAAHDLTIANADADLVTEQAATAQYDDLARQSAGRRRQLDALLALTPDTVLDIAATDAPPPPDPRAAAAAIAAIPAHRPDLVALRLGYAAQDAKLRAAILGQFPAFSFGFAASSDNSNNRNIGPQITLDIPIFDRNQGGIAIERATRQQLHDEYAARLAAATAEAQGMITEIAALARQEQAAESGAADLARGASAARAAYRGGDLAQPAYADLEVARLGRMQDALTARRARLEQSVALATLLGTGMPKMILPTAEAGL